MKRLRSLVLGLFALCSMVGMAQEAEADDTGYIVKVGQVAPDFTVTLTDGRTVTLSVRRCLLSKRIYGRSISPIRISC